MASGGSATQFPAAWYDGAPAYLLAARQDLGIKEKLPNGKSNPKVLAFFAAAGNGWVKDAIGTPWCAAWIGAKLVDAGLGCTKSLMARSYLKYGSKVTVPRAGDICITWRGRRDDGYTGHVFFVVRRDAKYVYGLGGNQGDSVTEQKFSRAKALGYVRPPEPHPVVWPEPIVAPAVEPAPVVEPTPPEAVRVAEPVIPPPTPPPVQRLPVAFPGTLAAMAWTTTVERDLAPVSRKVSIIGRARKTLHTIWAAIIGLFTLDNLGVAKSWIDQIKALAGDNVGLLLVIGSIAGLALLSYLLTLIADDKDRGRYQPSGGQP